MHFLPVCSLLQIPVSLGVSGYEGLSLYKGWRKLGSKGEAGTNFKVHQLIIYGLFGILAGLVGGLLGLGGGFIMGPLFLELGIPPQVSAGSSQCSVAYVSFFWLQKGSTIFFNYGRESYRLGNESIGIDCFFTLYD